jgi:hypothetical protein
VLSETSLEGGRWRYRSGEWGVETERGRFWRNGVWCLVETEGGSATTDVCDLTFKNSASYIYRTGIPRYPPDVAFYIFFFSEYKYWVF